MTHHGSDSSVLLRARCRDQLKSNDESVIQPSLNQRGVLGALQPSYTFVLLEADGSVSDILTVTIPDGFGGPVGPDWQELISVAFTSEDGLARPQAADCVLTETGLVQTCHLFSQTGDNILDIQIQSGVVEAPEPASLALLGLGLAVLGFSRRRKA